MRKHFSSATLKRAIRLILQIPCEIFSCARFCVSPMLFPIIASASIMTVTIFIVRSTLYIRATTFEGCASFVLKKRICQIQETYRAKPFLIPLRYPYLEQSLVAETDFLTRESKCACQTGTAVQPQLLPPLLLSISENTRPDYASDLHADCTTLFLPIFSRTVVKG